MARAGIAFARLGALLLVFACLPAFADVRAWLDRDRIGVGETTTLNIQTDEASVVAPDYAPLYGDFEVTGNTSSRQVENINGVTRTRILFAVALRPRRDGSIALPALRVGSQRTQPLSLTVNAAAPAPARAGGVVFIQTEADAQSPYVQQAVGYTVRLYYATSLIAGQLDQDAPEGATMQRIGEDLQYQREISGRRYTVVERRYLLIPERSGTINVPGARFRGQGVGGLFDEIFGDGRRELSATSAPRTLQVRPVPAGAPQPWLPLRKLELRYLFAPQAARAGEAATLTVQATADGASATQMPQLQLAGVDGAQVFAEPPQIEETFEQGRPRTRVVLKFSIVPARAGELRIPGPRVAWWDVVAGGARTASAPDLLLQVSPGAPGSMAAPDVAQPQPVGGKQRWIQVPFVQGAVQAWALAAVAFALLWLATLWWALHRKPPAGVSVTQMPDVSSPKARDAKPPGLQPALAAGDLHAVAAALCASATPAAPDLDAVCNRLEDPAQIAAVRALQQSQWGRGDVAQALAALRTAFARGPAWRKPGKQATPLLPPLYPERQPNCTT